MADTLTLSISVEGIAKSFARSLSPAEIAVVRDVVAPGADDVEITLGNLAKVKGIVVAGGEGVTFRKVAVTGSVLGADPFFAENFGETGVALTSIFVSNDGPQAVPVTVYVVGA